MQRSLPPQLQAPKRNGILFGAEHTDYRLPDRTDHPLPAHRSIVRLRAGGHQRADPRRAVVVAPAGDPSRIACQLMMVFHSMR